MTAEPPEPAERPSLEPEAATGKSIGARLLSAAERVRIIRVQIEAARTRHESVEIGLGTIERDSEIGGSLLAGAIAYRLFVFLLPLAVLFVAGLGLYANSSDYEPDEIAGDVGLTEAIADQIEAAANDTARWWVLLISLPILAYAVGQLFRAIAIVHALAFVGSGRALHLRPSSIGLFSLAIIGQLAVVNVIGALSVTAPVLLVLGVLLAVAALSALWLWVTTLFPHGSATLAQRLPGAILYAVGTLVLYLANTFLIGRLIEAREDTYGALGAAAALLFSMYLTGRLIVTAACLNATVAARAR